MAYLAFPLEYDYILWVMNKFLTAVLFSLQNNQILQGVDNQKKIKDVKYSTKEVKIKWFEDGTLNASANCIDRHLKDKKDKTAIIWVGDDPKDSQKISYKQLHQKVSKAANGLKKLGIKKGDRVTIYLTMIPELAILMLACVRIGVDINQVAGSQKDGRVIRKIVKKFLINNFTKKFQKQPMV